MQIRKLSRNRKIGVLSAIGLAALSVAAVSCWREYTAPAPELRVGYNTFAPYVLFDSKGVVSGLAVEVIDEAARRAGVRLRYVRSHDNVDEDFRAGRIDIFPLLALTPTRLKEFHTSQAWWDNEIALVSRDSASVTSAAGTARKRVAIRGLAVVKAMAERNFPAAELVIIPKLPEMLESLCGGKVDALFIDVRLLQSQLLKGSASCSTVPLHVQTLKEGNISLGTIASRSAARTADKIYEQIAELATDGFIAAAASHYSVISSSQNHHLKALLEAQRRTAFLRYGLATAVLVILLFGVQTHRIRAARIGAEENRQRFDAFMRHTPAIAFIKDERGDLVYLNREPADGTATDPWADGLANRLQAVDEAVFQTNRSQETIESFSVGQESPRHFLCLKFPFFGVNGQRLVGTVALDITERKRAEEALRFSQFSIDRSPDLIFWVDSETRIFYANDAAAHRLGYLPGEFLRKSFDEIDCGYGSQACKQIRGDLKSGGSITLESQHRTKNGEVFPVELSLNYLEFDGRDFVCCMTRDITSRKLAEKELSHQAEHDQLTGLPNRRTFEMRLGQHLDAASITGSHLAVFYIDLDGFKLINDTHGHSLGDALLQQVVRRFEKCIRDCDVLARMGGDEFTLIAVGIESEESALLLGEKLLSSLRESFLLAGHELMITASAGVSFAPRDGMDRTTLLRHADAAMYEAKREGKNRLRFFTPELNAIVSERLELEHRLRRAVERNELVLHYQPELSLITGEVVRHEALLRWKHPTLGLIAPLKFIPIAEETGLIVPIGGWVLEEACRHTRRCLDGGSGVGVAVNVSSVQFSRPDFVETVTNTLDRTGLPPSFLELELTESVVMQGLDEVAGKISQLRSLGVSVAIDDFGTGYSSLSYLQKLRIDSLKIDRSFIRDVPEDADALALTRALVSLAHGLGMDVVIEGVETQQQLEAVREIGCDIAQGFLIGRPSPAMLEFTLKAEDFQLAETA